ncbi:MAG: transposase [Anaerolineae bacterium]
MRHRLRLCFQIHCQNINFEKVIEFIILLHRYPRRKFILVLDRYSAHRKAVRLVQEEHPDWFEVEWLPAYAPDLNPVEMVWNHSKYGDLANLIPEDVDDLHQAVATSLENTGPQTQLMRSFSRYAGLNYSL